MTREVQRDLLQRSLYLARATIIDIERLIESGHTKYVPILAKVDQQATLLLDKLENLW